ncbi:MAG: DNA repair protein RadC [Oscillospiraceae bacterium]|nr:DNA repair protein RadC [Oscillospiraceae bacterium]
MGIHDGHRARKKEQFLRVGLDGFADHEALELLLFYAIPRRDTNPIAHALLQKFGSLDGVLNADVEELQRVEGVGESAALLLTLLPSIMRRAMHLPVKERILNSVESCGNYFLNLLGNERREVLYQACLDAKGKLLVCKKLSEGDADSAAFSVRQVVENALLSDASMVVLAHNHISGVALPSESDYIVTRRVKAALQAMDIELMDHIIVSDNDFVSMGQSSML